MSSKWVLCSLLFAQASWAQSFSSKSNDRAQERAKQAIPGYIDPEDTKKAATVTVVYTKPNCNPFFNSYGEIGSFGKQVIKSVEKIPDVYFNFVPKDFIGFEGRKICPNFKNMTLSQKRLFWVWMFRSLGHTESSCRQAPPVTIKKADKENKNPSWHADRGMFQLNYSSCGQVDLDKGVNAIACAIPLLAKEIKIRNKLTSSEVRNKTKNIYEATYWGPLRTDSGNTKRSQESIRNSKKTQETISRFAFCKAQPNTENEEREGDNDSDEMTVEIVNAKTRALFEPTVVYVKQKDGRLKEVITQPGVVIYDKAKTQIQKTEPTPKAQPVKE